MIKFGHDICLENMRSEKLSVSETSPERETAAYRKRHVSETEVCISETASTRIRNSICAYRKLARIGNRRVSETGPYRKQNGAYRKPQAHVSETHFERIENRRVSETTACRKPAPVGNAIRHIRHWCHTVGV